MRFSSRLAIGLIGAAATAFAVAPAVGATTVGTGFAGSLDVDAAPGEANAMTIRVRPLAGGDSAVRVADEGAPPVAGNGCSQTAGGAARCVVPGLYIVFAQLGDEGDSLAVRNRDPGVQLTIGAGDGADSVAVGPDGEVCLDGGTGADRLTITTPSEACLIQGRAGDDVLTGSTGYDRLYGGDGIDQVLGGRGGDYVYGDAGNDTVRGGGDADVVVDGGAGDDLVDGEAGNDSVSDGPGDDEIRGGPGADSLHSTFFFDSGDDTYVGGAGVDRFTYFCPACRISLDGLANDGRPGQGEADDVDAERIASPSRIPPDPDEGDPPINFGSGADRLVGDAADNVLTSYRGDDRLTGGGGSDRLNAGTGDDRLFAADGVADAAVVCGPGTDVAVVDAVDPTDGCENVTVR